MAPTPLNPESLPDFDVSQPLAGRYKVKGWGDKVAAKDSNVKRKHWFSTPCLPRDAIDKLTSIQLITKSHDQGWADYITGGNWTWFELNIRQKRDDKHVLKKATNGLVLAWESHHNQFLSKVATLCPGRVFTRADDIIRNLSPNDVLSVQLCARFRGWVNEAEAGYLILQFGPQAKDVQQNVGYSIPPPSLDPSEPTILAYGQRQRDYFLHPKHNTPLTLFGGIDLMGRLIEDSGNVNCHLINPDSMATHSAGGLSQGRAVLKRITKDENHTRLIVDQTDLPESFKPSAPSPELLCEMPITEATHTPKVIILSDAGVKDFAVDKETEYEAELLIYKMSAPLWKGPLWRKARKGPLYNGEHRQDRLIVVIDAEDLRAEGMQLSGHLSWEKLMEDFRTHFVGNVRAIKGRRMHILVRFGYECVFYLRSRSYFDCYMVPDKTEGALRKTPNGCMPGIDIAFVAGLVHVLAKETSNSLEALSFTTIEDAVKGALTWSSRFAAVGFPENPGPDGSDIYPSAQDINSDALRVAVITCSQEVMGNDGMWSIFSKLEKNVLRFAAEHVWRTPENILIRVPTASFGALLTADRVEIEGFRGTASLVDEYINNNLKRPLSISVFGQPGSGKSFGVKQVITAVIKKSNEDYELVEANLSQFKGLRDLAATFRKVRDVYSSKKIPVVLFDEFDSFFEQNLGWLKYFLGPCQDGQFLDTDDGSNIALKRAIFVFIGGTSSTYQHFIRDLHEDHAKKAKKADFVSRLSGYVNIRGTNQIAGGDEMYPIRRAIVLRSMLENRLAKKPGEISDVRELDVQEGILKALLEYPVFRHSTRSIDMILQMSRLSNRSCFRASALPSDDQLAMHVDVEDFKRRMRERLPGRRKLQIDPSLQEADELMDEDYAIMSDTSETLSEPEMTDFGSSSDGEAE